MLLMAGHQPQRSRPSGPTEPGFPHERSLLVWDGEGSRGSGRSAAESLDGRRSGG
jgi:hypothetical protein